jgi:hypothetical protein
MIGGNAQKSIRFQTKTDYCGYGLWHRLENLVLYTKQYACSTLAAIIFPPFLRLRVDGRKRFEYVMRNLRFQKYPHTCMWTGP